MIRTTLLYDRGWELLIEVYSALRGQGLYDVIPSYFWDSVNPVNRSTWTLERLYDCLIYVHGSTSSSQYGMTLTLAHELQHFVQYSRDRTTWALDRLLRELPAPYNEEFRNWYDFPIEREARIVAKGIAAQIHGYGAIVDYINEKIAEQLTDADVVDWKFLLSSESDGQYSAAEETRRLVRRFKMPLMELQNQDWSDCKEVKVIDLPSY